MSRPSKTGLLVSEDRIPAVWQLWRQAGQRPRMRLTGLSMEPMIQDGEELLIEPQPTRIWLGDVVVYRGAGCFVAHRVVRRWHAAGEEFFLLKGDRVSHFDPPVPRGQILGRVVGKEDAAGFVDYDTWGRRTGHRALALWSFAAGHGVGFYRTLRYHLGNPSRSLRRLRDRLVSRSVKTDS